MPDKPVEQQFLEYILESIITKKEGLTLVRTVDEMGVLYTVTVAPEDVGKVLGKNGEIAKAIRSLLRLVSHDNKVRATMKINAPYIKKDTTPTV